MELELDDDVHKLDEDQADNDNAHDDENPRSNPLGLEKFLHENVGRGRTRPGLELQASFAN